MVATLDWFGANEPFVARDVSAWLADENADRAELVRIGSVFHRPTHALVINYFRLNNDNRRR